MLTVNQKIADYRRLHGEYEMELAARYPKSQHLLLRYYIVRHLRMSLFALVFLLSATFPDVTLADTIRPVDGRIYEPVELMGLSLEVRQQQHEAVERNSLRASLALKGTGLALFVDAMSSQARVDDLTVTGDLHFSGTGGGIGFFYFGIPDLMSMQSTLRIDYHQEATEADDRLAVGGRQADIERDSVSPSIAILWSPRKALLDNGLNGYVSVGLSHLREKQTLLVDGEFEPRLSKRDSRINGNLEAGLVFPLGRFRFYAVAVFEEEASVSAGVRIRLGRPVDAN